MLTSRSVPCCVKTVKCENDALSCCIPLSHLMRVCIFISDGNEITRSPNWSTDLPEGSLNAQHLSFLMLQHLEVLSQPQLSRLGDSITACRRKAAASFRSTATAAATEAETFGAVAGSRKVDQPMVDLPDGDRGGKENDEQEEEVEEMEAEEVISPSGTGSSTMADSRCSGGPPWVVCFSRGSQRRAAERLVHLEAAGAPTPDILITSGGTKVWTAPVWGKICVFISTSGRAQDCRHLKHDLRDPVSSVYRCGRGVDPHPGMPPPLAAPGCSARIGSHALEGGG